MMKSFFAIFFLVGFNVNANLKEFSIGIKDPKGLNSPINGDDCTDYSGKWSGSCVTNGKSEKESMAIGQFACDAWFLDSFPDFLYLNGKKTISDTDFAGPDAPYTKEQIFESKMDSDKIVMTITQKNSKSSKPLFSSTGIFNLKADSSLVVEWNNSSGENKVCTMLKN